MRDFDLSAARLVKDNRLISVTRSLMEIGQTIPSKIKVSRNQLDAIVKYVYLVVQ